MARSSGYRRSTTCLLLVAAAALAGAAAGRSDAKAEEPMATAPRRAVAVTFDDLPGTAVVGGDCDAAAIRDLNRRLLAQVARFDVPATGLVTGSRVCDALRAELLPELLAAWLDDGHDLGNHTFSHPDLDRVPLDEYQRDIVRGEEVVAGLLADRGSRLRYFRHPYLHTGAEAAKRRAVAEFLSSRGYTVAPVTMDNQEWIFAAVYTKAKERGDEGTMRRVAEAYVPFMEGVFAFFEDRSREVFGREIPQVLLLHVNELNADHFGELARMARRRGYHFVTLDEALADEAYGSEDGYVGPQGLSWLHRWAAARGLPMRQEPREPEWLGELFRGYPGE